MSHQVKVQLLGSFEVRVDGVPVELGGPRQQAVLAALVLEPGRRVSADRLLDAVWGESATRVKMSALYAYIARLRKSLGPAGPMLRGGPGGYVVELAKEDVDAARFDAVVAGVIGGPGQPDPHQVVAALEPALSWWQGPPLDGCLTDLPWTVPFREHLQERRIAAIEALANAWLLLGRQEAAVQLLEDAVVEYPHRENLVSQLMLGLYRVGRQADALTAYADCRARLDEELGVAPSEMLRNLHRAILKQRPELRWQPPRQPARRLLPLRNPQFFGRSALVTDIAVRLEQSRVVALHGIGGAGKSVVALEVAHAHRGYACWINAENDAATMASLMAIAADRGIRVSGPVDTAQMLRHLWTELAAEPTPLLVFDNAADPAALVPYLPRMEHARVLVTSRSAGWGALGTDVRVGPFSAEEAAAYVLDRTKSADRAGARELAEDLGRLPLACAQAVAFIEQSGISIGKYRELFTRQREGLLARAAPDGYGQTVATTWQLAFEKLATDASPPRRCSRSWRSCRRRKSPTGWYGVCSRCPTRSWLSQNFVATPWSSIKGHT